MALYAALMVKDEAKTIGTTIASALPHVDAVVVLDTGSTDGTQGAVREACGEKPLLIAESPFVDFATSRNTLLDVIDARAGDGDWAVLFDADDKLLGGGGLAPLRERSSAAGAVGADAAYLPVLMGGTRFLSPRLYRARGPFRYQGAVHEVLVGPTAPAPPPAGVFIGHDPPDLEKSRRRWSRDRLLLEAEVRKDPTHTRHAFYLAQTYDCLGEKELALAAYRRRVELGGWDEEVFEARLRAARMREALAHPWAEVQDDYLSCYASRPSRAEPLFAIAKKYHLDALAASGEARARSMRLAHTFAVLAASKGLPGDVLFVDAELYVWRAHALCALTGFCCGEEAIARWAAERSLACAPPDDPAARELASRLGLENSDRPGPS